MNSGNSRGMLARAESLTRLLSTRLDTFGQSASDWLRGLEGRVAVGLTVVIYVLSRNFGLFDSAAPFYQHLGAEYYNIAAALVDGRGFSDPFAERTGPTAWMPPLFPFLLAGILKVVGSRALVAEVVVFLSNGSMVAVGLLLFRMARRAKTTLSPLWIVGLYVVWLWTFYGWFFMMTHDIWLLMLLIALIAHTLFDYADTGALKRWRWGLLGGAAALTSPSIAFGWAAATAAICWRGGRNWRALVLPLALAGCLGAPWVARNAVVFGKFIPTKSNLFYEAYSANYQHERGIYEGSFEDHPYMSPTTRFEYGRLGEMGFIDEHRVKLLNALESNPGQYVRGVFNRALAVTVNYVAHKDEHIPLAKRVIQNVVYAMPFLGLLITLLINRRSTFVPLIATFSGLYLTPYVIVAFYARYQLVLTAVLVLFTFFGLDQLARLYLQRRDALLRSNVSSKAG